MAIVQRPKVFLPLLFGVLLGASCVYWSCPPVVNAQRPSAASLIQRITDLEIEMAMVPTAPVGSIVAWHGSHAGTPALPPDGWVECNGQTVADSASPYDGQVVPNLNGEHRFLRGSHTSGILQYHATETHHHTIAHTHSYTDRYDYRTGTDQNYLGWSEGRYVTEGKTTGGPSNSNSGNPAGCSYPTENETRPINMSVIWIMRIK